MPPEMYRCARLNPRLSFLRLSQSLAVPESKA